MASTFTPGMPKAGLPTRNKNGKRVISASQHAYGLGISGFVTHEPRYDSSSADQSPERPTEKGPDDNKEKLYRQISQTVSNLNAQVYQLYTPETTPVLKQVGSTRNSPGPDQSVQDPVENVQNEPPTIAQLQKDAAASHSATITELLKEYLPSPLLKPHPPPSEDKPNLSEPIPSILDLEVRHAIASAPIHVYLNHIPSKVAREEFLRRLTKSEEQHFGHGSQVATAMHEESVEAEKDELKKGIMRAKWNDKGCRREMRKKELRDALIMEVGLGAEKKVQEEPLVHGTEDVSEDSEA